MQYLPFQQYYRAKGASPSTRPDEIPETFELCMDSLIERLHSYQIQAEEYRRECIDGMSDNLYRPADTWCVFSVCV